VLWTGLAGTSLLVLGGTFYAVSRVWASSFTQTLEVMVASPFVGMWMLSPLLYATRPGRAPDAERGASKSDQWTDILLVAVAAVAYVWTFVVEPLGFGIEVEPGALLVVMSVPVIQWGVIFGGGMMGSMLDPGGGSS
jgi:hypothetical protein